MVKIFRYELMRLLFNKFFAGLLLAVLFYSRQVMLGKTILGVANTAPFSPWSFGSYLAGLQPVLMVSLLFFISFLCSRQAKAARSIIEATAVSPQGYRIVRYGAIALSFFLITALPLAYAFWLYGSVFHFTAWETLIGPLALTVIPPFLLVMGLGLLASQIHASLVFALIPAVLLIGYLPLPGMMELYGTWLYTVFPGTLGVLDPEFLVPASFLGARAIYSATGVVLIVIAIRKKRPFLF